MLKDSLLQLGLDEKEASIYLAALELGPSSIQAIAKKSGVKRSTIYGIISDLKNKKLFSETIKGKKRLFIAAAPEELKTLISRQEQILAKIMPELKGLFNMEAGKPKIHYYETPEEMRLAELATLEDNPDEVLSLALANNRLDMFDWGHIEKFIQARVAKGIKSRHITNHKEAIKQFSPRDTNELREIKFLPKENVSTTDFQIYDNKVLILSFGKERYGLLIESEDISKTMRTLFEFMWDKLE